MLLAQLEQSDYITQRRISLWQQYHEAFAGLEAQGLVRRPTIPADCQHNAHIYYLITDSLETRTALLAYLKQNGVRSTFHYVPLHSAPAGRAYGRQSGSLAVTNDLSDRLVRLPLGAGMSMLSGQQVIEQVLSFFERRAVAVN